MPKVRSAFSDSLLRTGEGEMGAGRRPVPERDLRECGPGAPDDLVPGHSPNGGSLAQVLRISRALVKGVMSPPSSFSSDSGE